MSTHQAEDTRDTDIVQLRATEAHESDLAGTPAPAYADVTDNTVIKRQPVIPVPLQRDNIKGTVEQAAGLGWHRVRYHGLRSPMYLVMYLVRVVRGSAVLTGRLWNWWQSIEHHVLLSEAVAAGRPGHQHAMSADAAGRKVRKSRSQILGSIVALILIAGLVMAKFAPWWGWALCAVAAVAVLERHGRKPGKPLLKAAVMPAAYQPPTPEIITRALGSLGISGINDAIKDGRGLNFITDVHRDGEGWATELDLPHGVTTGMILQRRAQLSAGLRRPLSATWPEGVPHEHEGRLRLWIGFQDLSKVKPKAWPLLRSGQADIFASIPFATDPRGREISAPLFAVNWLIGAAPGNGKTSAVRVLACGAALDPVCDLWVHELAGKGDLEPLSQVSHRYVSGLDDESIAYTATSVRMLREELERRSGKLKEVPRDQRPDGSVTRELASKRSLRLRPIACIIDELQNLIMHPDLGPQAAQDIAYVIRMGRAYGIIFILATQKPSAETVPTAISGNVTMRLCLKVPGQPENDAILGTGSYRAGYDAAAFRGKTDAGLGWLRSDADPQVVKTFYLDLPDTQRITQRARAVREAAAVLSGYALGQDDRELPRSFAADVVAVFGMDDKLWCSTIAGRLAASFPGVYPSITPAATGSQLRGLGVTVKNVREPGGQPAPGCERAAVEAVTS
jgi:DNA segregation ATPase FtsK/SpoIIIE, S-DNA-T family